MRLWLAIVAFAAATTACGGRVGPTTTAAPPATPSSEATTTTSAATTTEGPDTTPPELTILDPEADGYVSQSVYTFRGVTEPGVSVVAAGRYPADVEADGSWSVILVLGEGGNLASFTATDAAGNVTRVSMQVEYRPRFEGNCGDLPRDLIPDDVADLAATFGDVDGDGADDVITVYESGGAAYLHFALAYGWSVATRLSGSRPEGVDGVIDLGGPVVLLQRAGTSDGSTYELLALTGCEIVAVTEPDGSVRTLFSGYRDTDAGWFSCDPEGVTQVVAFVDAGAVRVQIHEYVYDPAKATLTEVDAVDELESGGLASVTDRLLGIYPSCA